MNKYKPDPATTRTGIIFGAALSNTEKRYTRDMEILQAALLNTATAAPTSLLERITTRLRQLLY